MSLLDSLCVQHSLPPNHMESMQYHANLRTEGLPGKALASGHLGTARRPSWFGGGF